MTTTSSTASPVGLYSIAVRGLEVPDLLAWAARHSIPFVHLRGGQRGYDLAAQEPGTLRRWRQTSAATVPITGITADTDLADLMTSDPLRRRAAVDQVQRLADAAHTLGASWVRLPARNPLHPMTETNNANDDIGADHDADHDDRAGAGLFEVADLAVPLLIELHHPLWLARRPHAALVRLLTRQPRLRLLADSAQLARAVARLHNGPRHSIRNGTGGAMDGVGGGGRAAERLHRLGPWIGVLHLSDHGLGLTAPGHSIVADQVSRHIAGGRRVEVAVEWTGADRTPATALARYREHAAWWATRHTTSQKAVS